MNKKFLSIVGAGAAVSCITYFGLNAVAPYHKEEPKEAATVTVDQVFSGGLKEPSENAKTPDGSATDSQPAAPSAAKVEPADAEDLAQAAAPAAEGDETGAGTATSAPATPPPAEKPAAEPAPAAEAPKPAESKPAPQPAAPKTEQAEAAKPAKAPAAPKAEAKSEPKSESKPAPAKSAEPAAAATAWWGKEEPGKLAVVFAGPSAGEKAVAVLFNGAFDDASAGSKIKVLDAKGAAVSGNWELSPKNKRMMIFAVKSNGTYTLALSHGIKDREGHVLEKDLRGPVVVK